MALPFELVAVLLWSTAIVCFGLGFLFGRLKHT